MSTKKQRIGCIFFVLAFIVQTIAFYVLWHDNNDENDPFPRNYWRLYLNRLFLLAFGYQMLRHEMSILYDVFIVQKPTIATNKKVKEEEDTDSTAANSQRLQRPDFVNKENQNQEGTLSMQQLEIVHKLSMDDEESSNESQKRSRSRSRRWSRKQHQQSMVQKYDVNQFLRNKNACHMCSYQTFFASRTLRCCPGREGVFAIKGWTD